MESARTLRSHAPPRWLTPVPEDRAADPDMRRAELHRRLEIGTHAHAQRGKPVRLREFGQQREMQRRLLVVRRDAHQAGDLELQLVAAQREEGGQIARRDTRLLRFLAGVDLDEKLEATALRWPSPRRPLARSSAGRSYGCSRTAPPPRAPCWTAAGRSDAARHRQSARAGPATCPWLPARGSRRTRAGRPRARARSPPRRTSSIRRSVSRRRVAPDLACGSGDARADSVEGGMGG